MIERGVLYRPGMRCLHPFVEGVRQGEYMVTGRVFDAVSAWADQLTGGSLLGTPDYKVQLCEKGVEIHRGSRLYVRVRER